MKKILINILLCALPLIGSAQSSRATDPTGSAVKYSFIHKIIKHLDLAVSAGTCGFGFEASAPLTKWSDIRLGGTILPSTTYNATLTVWRPLGMSDDDNVMKMISSCMNATPSSTISMEGERRMQNVKLLWDIYPIKGHRNFHVTLGVYWGNRDLVSGINTNNSFSTLTFMREYNMLYRNAQNGQFLDFSSLGFTLPDNAQSTLDEKVLSRIREAGDMTIPIGTYAHDIYGSDGQLLHSKDEYVMLRPDADDIIRVDATVNRFKPFLGIGYTLPVSKDKRTSITLDAGVILWGNKPSVTTHVVEGVDSEGNEVTTTIDLLNDVNHLPGDFGRYIRSASSYPVYPEVNIRFTRNIW